jgi:hypothetical protein
MFAEIATSSSAARRVFSSTSIKTRRSSAAARTITPTINGPTESAAAMAIAIGGLSLYAGEASGDHKQECGEDRQRRRAGGARPMRIGRNVYRRSSIDASK